jgi:hypothetical protein
VQYRHRKRLPNKVLTLRDMNAEKARQIEENRLRALEKLQSNRQSAAIIASKNAQLPQLTAQIVPNPPLKQSVVPPAPQRRPTASFDLRLDSLTHFSIHPWHEALLGPGSEFRLKFPQSDRYMKQSVCLPIALYAEVLQFFQCGDLRKKWQITLTTPPRSVP